MFISGCGGGSGSKKAAPSSTTTPAPTTVPPPGAQQLQMIVVQSTDLPAGWTSSAASPPADLSDGFAGCMGTPNTAGEMVASASSPQFTSGSYVIGSTAKSFRSPAAVLADTAALTNPKASSCLATVNKAHLAAGKGVTVRTVTFKVTPGTGGGPSNVVATATSALSYTLNGHTTTLNDETVYFVAPRIEARVDFYYATKAPSASVKAAVISKVSARVTFGS
jgi:hypothetical protein